MNRLKDKRALITGGTSGIGLETARLFLAEGARVAITGRNPETLDAARKELAETLRDSQLIARGIRVNAVSPGPISTPLYGKLGLSAADLKTVAASVQSLVPAGRFGDPREIANAVVFLASDESAFTVGSDLMIDGGMGNL